MLATWHHKFPSVPAEQVEALINKLTDPPSYRLPVSSTGHTRHYMPAGNATPKVFDSFLAVRKDNPVNIYWSNVTLTNDEQSLLQELLTTLNYFGRGESCVLASCTNSSADEINAWPLDQGGVAEGQILRRTLAAMDSSLFEQWRTEQIRNRSSKVIEAKKLLAMSKNKPVAKLKLTAKEQEKIGEQLPASLLEALHVETTALRKSGWTCPPGGRWIDYVLSTTISHSQSMTFPLANRQRLSLHGTRYRIRRSEFDRGRAVRRSRPPS